MKKICAVMAILLLATLLPASCSRTPDVSLEMDYDQLAGEKHISRQVTLDHPGMLAVSLYSNGTTGFQWSPNIGDAGVLRQQSHSYTVPKDNGLVGAGGYYRWTFASLRQGTTVVSFDYSQPWANGEKGTWTVELTVTVE